MSISMLTALAMVAALVAADHPAGLTAPPLLAEGPPAGSTPTALLGADLSAGVKTAAAWSAVACSASGPAAPATFERTAGSAPGAPYYAIDLVSTKNVAGTARARGTGHVAFAASPFGVAIAADGSYRYDVELRLTGMDRPAGGRLVAWVTTPQVDRIRRLGAFDDDLSVRGEVSWNKFLVVVTLEDRDDPAAETWSGPIVLRGMSRSGAMHTMAGHGPFQQELCAKYGY
jgi:hypothetical protein